MSLRVIWTGPSPKKYYMDLGSFGPCNIFWVTDMSIYCHMTLSAMNYLIIPFCLFSYMDVKYGAISILLTARFRNESIPLDTVYSKIECDKLHIKFCKRVLGVHQKSTNFAVLSELGHFPIHSNN